MSSGKSSWETLRQGSVLAKSMYLSVMEACIDRKPDCTDMNRLIVVSQDCDIVASPRSEPYIELIPAKVCRKVDSGKMRGKSSRYIVLCAGKTILEMCVHDRFRIPKDAVEWLLDSDCILPDAAVNEFKGWLARRYRRAAFPDAFESRIREKDDELRVLLSGDNARNIAAIYLKTSGEELSKDQSYHLDVLLAKEAVSPTEPFEEDLLGILNSCDGIIIGELNSMQEKDITLGLLREYLRWNKDFYSSFEDGGVARPLEE